MAPALRDQIAARRAEANPTAQPSRSGNAPTRTDDGVMEDRTVSSQVRRTTRSGKLDISSLSLERIPIEVYTDLLGLDPSALSRSPDPQPTIDVNSVTRALRSVMGLGEQSSNPFGTAQKSKRDEWVEPEELVGFKASENELRGLDVEFGAFGGLKSVDLRGNRLSELPRSFADLLRLTTVDLSHNAFTNFPSALLLLPALQVLDLSHNSMTSIGFGSPVAPSDEGLTYGAGFLTTSISRASVNKGPKQVLPVLRSLNLGHNKLRNDQLKPLAGLKALRVLNLEHNSLNGVLDLVEAGLSGDNLPNVASLVLSGNTGLRAVIGAIAANGKVETVGCHLLGTSSETSAGSSSSKQLTSAASAVPIPLATTTLTYRTLPAATFDSLPLDVEFDLYLPAIPCPGAGHPLVIWFHGGGLLQGNKENLPPHFRRLPTYDYGGTNVAVISPNYRLAPQVPILEILEDVTVLLNYVRTKLNSKIGEDHRIDTERICLSGGSAGGYLALIAGLKMPKNVSDEQVGGYEGEGGIKCIAPFYPITDLTDAFWSTEVDHVPWRSTPVSHEEAKPHLDLKAAPVATSISGGPRSVLYSYMLQHSLFPSLLFMKQKSVGQGDRSFRPEPRTLSVTHRLGLMRQPRPPVYLIYGTADTAVQPFVKTVEALRKTEGELTIEVREGLNHAFDEDAGEECEAFREWLGKYLI